MRLATQADVYVGLSTRRHEGESGRACVVRLDLESLTPRERWAMDCDEVFSLVWADDSLLSGVIRGVAALPGGPQPR